MFILSPLSSFLENIFIFFDLPILLMEYQQFSVQQRIFVKLIWSISALILLSASLYFIILYFYFRLQDTNQMKFLAGKFNIPFKVLDKTDMFQHSVGASVLSCPGISLLQHCLIQFDTFSSKHEVRPPPLNFFFQLIYFFVAKI